jgi:7-carboxy-7-deazaguanine synthase
MEIGAILQKAESYNCKLIEITGGEPLLQDNIHKLLKCLCDRNFNVMIETGGHHDIGGIDPRVKKIMDIKCPGSGMEKKNRWKNIVILASDDEVKFVIADRIDYDWAKNVIQKYGLDKRCSILMTPVFGKLENRTLAEWILHDHLNVQFQVQLHKYIWDPLKRGV